MNAKISTMSVLIPIMIGVLLLFAIIAVAYFLIYKRHINKVLKDGNNDKKRVRLPAIGTSYTGMWFIAWVIAVSVVIIQVFQIDTYVETANAEISNLQSQVRALQEDADWKDEQIYGIFRDIGADSYISFCNYSFVKYDVDTHTVRWNITFSTPRMYDGDSITVRIGNVRKKMTPDFKRKEFKTAIDIDVFDADQTQGSVPVIAIIDVEGVKKTENFSLSTATRVITEGEDDDTEIEWQNFFPAVQVIEEDRSVLFGIEDGSYRKQDIELKVDFSFSLFSAAYDESHYITDAKLICMKDGKKIFEENICKSNPSDDHTKVTVEKSIEKTIDNVDSRNSIDFFIELKDNKGYTYYGEIDSNAIDNYTITDKNGKTIFETDRYYM